MKFIITRTPRVAGMNQREREQAHAAALAACIETATMLNSGLITLAEFFAKVAETHSATPPLQSGDIDPATGLRV